MAATELFPAASPAMRQSMVRPSILQGRQRRALSLIASLLLVAACATLPEPAIEAPAASPPQQKGTEQLLHHPPEAALRLLGAPRLDKKEGPARMLQFSGSCILDIWYYPDAKGVLAATYADAHFPNGTEIAAGDCLRSLLKARELARPTPEK